VAADDLAHHFEVTLSILLLPEAGPQHLAGGVVDGSDQAQQRSAPLQPVMAPGVDLDQHPRLGIAVAPAPVTGRSPLMGCRDAGGGQDAMDTGSRDAQLVLLAGHLGQMLPVEPGVDRGGQLHHPAPELWVDGMGWSAATVAVGQGDGSQLGIGSLHPLQLTHGELEQPSRLGVDERARLQMVGNDEASLLRRSQGDPASIHGVTESQNCWG
jgi:hypothetical protein